MTLKVSAVSAESPEMDREEFAEFVEDIRANGQRVPIVLCGGEVIDGRKRLAACERLGIKPKTVELEPGADPRVAARSLNVLRTHYSKSQRALFAATRANSHRGGIGGQSAVLPIAPVTVEQAAKEAGVSPRYVGQARRVMREAPAETVEKVRAGKMTLDAAAKATDVAAGRRPANGRDPRVGSYAPKKGAVARYAATVERVGVAVSYLSQYLCDVNGASERGAIALSLRRIRTELSGVIAQLDKEAAA